VGDSLELCRRLDAYGFSDLERSISHNVALAPFLPNNHPWKFSLHTSKDVMRKMREVWINCAPTSERICQDINDFDHVLDMIINSEGTIVRSEGLRHGRRAMNHKGSKELITRLKASKRKSTLSEADIHPELRLIREEIVNSEDGTINIANVVQRLAEATAEAEQQAFDQELVQELQQENQQEDTTREDLGHDMEGEEEE